jgi:hypothetical protein
LTGINAALIIEDRNDVDPDDVDSSLSALGVNLGDCSFDPVPHRLRPGIQPGLSFLIGQER